MNTNRIRPLTDYKPTWTQRNVRNFYLLAFNIVGGCLLALLLWLYPLDWGVY